MIANVITESSLITFESSWRTRDRTQNRRLTGVEYFSCGQDGWNVGIAD